MHSDQQPEWVRDRRRAIGDRIRERRNEVNLTQIQLCYIVGVDRTTFQRFESGLSDPHLGELLLIAEALDISLDALVHVARRAT